MRGFRTRCLTSAVVIAGVMSVYAAPAAAHNNVGAAIAAGVLGLAVGAAVAADGGPRDHVIYGPPPPPFAPPPPGFDGPPPPPAYGPPPPPFFPERGIACYPAQQACYQDGRGFSPWWTARIYGDR